MLLNRLYLISKRNTPKKVPLGKRYIIHMNIKGQVRASLKKPSYSSCGSAGLRLAFALRANVDRANYRKNQNDQFVFREVLHLSKTKQEGE